MIAALIPAVAVGDSVFLIEQPEPRARAILLAQLNSFAFDFVVRQKLSGLNLNFFYVKQFPVIGPETFDRDAPWSNDAKLGDWTVRRVVELTCTASDMSAFA